MAEKGFTGGKTVLITDDNGEFTDNLRDILESAGYTVMVAASCQEAMATVVREKPKVAVVDLKLPDGSGTDLLADIKGVMPGCECVVLTGYGDFDSVLAAMNAGAFFYLQKAGSVEKLLKVVDAMFEKVWLQEERVQMNAALQRSERLSAVGRLARGVGHELQNTLGALKSAAYFLGISTDGSDPEFRETVEIVSREVAVSERIIKNLLEYSEQEEAVMGKVDLGDVVRKLLCEIDLPGDISVVNRLETLPVVVNGPEKYRQVFLNILHNAVHSMPDGGQLRIEPDLSDDRWTRVAISDTGTGIRQEDVEKLFEPLFTTRPKGIGIGMTLSRSIVERSGGDIEVSSVPGKGSVFTVRLPNNGACCSAVTG